MCVRTLPPPSSLSRSFGQGIELSNPLAARALEQDAAKAGTESYFSERAGFRSLTAQSTVGGAKK